MMPIRGLLPTFLLFLFPLAALAGQAREEEGQDAIEMIGASSLTNVKVIEDTWIKVQARKFQVVTDIPSYKVKKVVYAAAPELYRTAQDAAEQGDYEKALRALVLILKRDADKYAWFKQYLYFDIARYYMRYSGEASYEKARGYLDQLMNEVPTSRFMPDALLLYADSIFQEGKDFEAAYKAYENASDKLASMFRQVTGPHIDYLQEKALLAEYKKGEALVLLRRYGEAKSVFKGVASKSGKYPRVMYLAMLGEAQAFWAEQQLDEALKAFQTLIEGAENAGIRDILAGGYAGLGDCYFEKREYEEARWNYLKVAVQFFDSEEYAAKCIYRVALCYREIMLKEQDPKKRDEAKKQAAFYFNEVIDNYQGYWVEQAKNEKGKL